MNPTYSVAARMSKMGADRSWSGSCGLLWPPLVVSSAVDIFCEWLPEHTMKYALLSDVHGNLPALDAVLGEIARRSDVDAVFHLGYLVGYGPWPNEVVGRLREAGIRGVSGNYDSTVATRYKHCGCRYEDPRQEA